MAHFAVGQGLSDGSLDQDPPHLDPIFDRSGPCARFAVEFCPASNSTVIVGRGDVGLTGIAGEVGVPRGEVLDQGRRLGDVGPVPWVGIPDQWDATGPGDDHAQSDQA